jgi:hypothetical protein
MNFPPHKAGLYLTHNEHRDYYESVCQWVDWRNLGDCWVNDEQKEKAIERDELWILQWYPETPVAFCMLIGADLDVVMAAASKEQS